MSEQRFSDDKLVIYLAANNITDFTKFQLRDNSDGKGPYNAKWAYDIDQPDVSILDCTEDPKSICLQAKLIREPNAYFADPDFIKFMFPDIEKKYQDYLAQLN